MNRSDERKETSASLARTPEAARSAEKSHLKPEPESAGPKLETHDEGASMARSPAAARSETARDQRSQGGGPRGNSVRTEAGMPKKSVETDGSTGGRASVSATAAEGVSDDASPKANRKEAMEPERERDEKAAISRNEVKHSGPIQTDRGGQEVPYRNVMGHGQRATVAKNTI